MPLIFITRSGSTPISNMASMMRSEMALCPHPAHSVGLAADTPRSATQYDSASALGPIRSCGGHYSPPWWQTRR